jgi:hypothetical protein
MQYLDWIVGIVGCRCGLCGVFPEMKNRVDWEMNGGRADPLASWEARGRSLCFFSHRGRLPGHL